MWVRFAIKVDVMTLFFNIVLLYKAKTIVAVNEFVHYTFWSRCSTRSVVGIKIVTKPVSKI